LTPLTRDDVEPLLEAASESREHYAFTSVPESEPEMRAYVEHALAQTDRCPFAIRWQGSCVGSTSYLGIQVWQWPAGCALQRSDRPDAVEIGSTWLASSAQRTRCNTEAKYLLLSHAFEVWRVHKVSLCTDERNLRSRRAIEGLGAKLDGIVRADKPAADCSVRNSAYYSILAYEWGEVRARLAGRLARSG
jgi:RimJ/RimL family protein N-acetyltransferase